MAWVNDDLSKYDNYKAVADLKREMLVAEAKKWVGVQEQGGDNRGPMVERFQKAVDGIAHGEPWCCSFVQFCIGMVDGWNNPNWTIFEGSKSRCVATEHCMTMWEDSPEECRRSEPIPGSLAIWQYYRSGIPTRSGHIGVVVSAASKYMMTIEGNTSGSASASVVREGDGVFEKKRSIFGSGRMKIKGFLVPWTH